MGQYTSPKQLLVIFKYLKDNHHVQFIDTRCLVRGGLSSAYWTVDEFRRWFMSCLMNKINRNDTQTGRKHTEQYQSDMRYDARIINEYMGTRIRHTGCRMLLRTKEMQRLYPYINNQVD
jgi:hypothetical protein